MNRNGVCVRVASSWCLWSVTDTGVEMCRTRQVERVQRGVSQRVTGVSSEDFRDSQSVGARGSPVLATTVKR